MPSVVGKSASGSPAESLISDAADLGDDPDDSPETTRDTEEDAGIFSDEFYSHDTDDETERDNNSDNALSLSSSYHKHQRQTDGGSTLVSCPSTSTTLNP